MSRRADEIADEEGDSLHADGLLACQAAIALTTLIHDEVLSALDLRLPAMQIPHRNKLLAVMASLSSRTSGSLRTGIALTLANCIDPCLDRGPIAKLVLRGLASLTWQSKAIATCSI